MLLEDRNAAIYGEGGAIGSVAWTFAREGERLPRLDRLALCRVGRR